MPMNVNQKAVLMVNMIVVKAMVVVFQDHGNVMFHGAIVMIA